MKSVTVLLLTAVFALSSGAAMAQMKEDNGAPFGQRELSKSVRLYPNPAIEFVNIKFEEPVAKRTQVTLHNILGSAMESEQEVIDEYEIRVRIKDLPTGYYLLALKDQLSDQRGTFKFLKR